MIIPLFRAVVLTGCLFPLAALRAQDEPTGPARAQAAHVVVIVWDGLRPDSVREEDTPTLARLAREGVFFHPAPCRLPHFHGGQRDGDGHGLLSRHQRGDRQP